MPRMPKNGRVVGPVEIGQRDPRKRYVTVEWIENGHRLVADFALIGWRLGTPEINAETNRMFSNPPIVTYHGGQRHRAGRATGR